MVTFTPRPRPNTAPRSNFRVIFLGKTRSPGISQFPGRRRKVAWPEPAAARAARRGLWVDTPLTVRTSIPGDPDLTPPDAAGPSDSLALAAGTAPRAQTGFWGRPAHITKNA